MQSKKLNECGTFGKGLGIKKDESNSGEIPAIRYGEIYTDHNEIVRQFRSMISSEVASKSKTIHYGDILFACSGETKEEIGKCVAYIKKIEAYAGGDLIVFTPNTSLLDPTWLGYYLNSANIQKQKSSQGQGDAVVHISMGAVANLIINFPSIFEQRRIAAILTNLDDLIEAHEALIAKKTAIKEATMVLLLNGEKRLPGFSGKWNINPLGKILKICHGKSQKGVAVKNGDYPILASSGEIGRASAFLYDKPSVLIGRKGTIDAPQYMATPFWSIDTLYYTDIGHLAHPKFIFYVFQTIPWRTYNEASGVPSLTAARIESINISLPPLDEQMKIAKIISDCDEELNCLSSELIKLFNQKSAVMHKLLTGEIRVPDLGITDVQASSSVKING